MWRQVIKTHSSASAAKKKEDMRHTSLLFTGTIKLPNSGFCISKTTKLISTKFIYFLPYIYTTSHIKIEGNRFNSCRDICSWKLSNFLLRTKLQNNLLMLRFLSNFWNTNNAHWCLYISLKFWRILRKIEGSAYVQFFSKFAVAPTVCIINAMDLEIFPNIIMLLKVDCFEGFSNRNNITELAINSMSGCNCKNYNFNQ